MSLLDAVFDPIIEPQVVTLKQIFKDDTTFDGVTNSFSQYPKIDLNTYTDPSNEFEFCPKRYIDEVVALKLSIDDAESTYTKKSDSLHSNAWYLNAGVNTLSSVLTDIGSSTQQTIFLSSGGHHDAGSSTPTEISKTYLTITAPQSAMNSPCATYYSPITILGSTTQGIKFSGISFEEPIIINGTLGKHFFTNCTFKKQFTLQNSTSNWIQFYNCSFAGTVTVPNTFASFITFYMCDFQSASMTLNNVSSQQVIFYSCVNLNSLTMNGTYLGFNNTASLSSISTNNLNVQGTTTFPSGSINSTSINNSSFVDLSNTQTITGTKTFSNGLTLHGGLTTETQTLSQATLDKIQYLSNVSADINTSLNSKTTESFVTSSINTAINNLINGATGTMDTLGEIANILSTNVNDIGTLTTAIAGRVSKTANETISGIITFSQAPIMSGASITAGTIADTSLASTFLKTSDASSTYLTQSNASSTYTTQSSTTSALALKANLESPELTGTPICPTASTATNSTQIASTAYVKSNLSSYQTTLSGSSNITVGTLACTSLTPTGIITSTRFTEQMTSVNHGSNIYTLNFNTGNVWFSGNSTTGNFTVNLTNIPLSSDTRQFTFSLITNGTTHICTSASATNTSSGTIVGTTAPRNVGGTAPTIPANVVCIHTFTLMQCFSTDYILYSTTVFN
jgi:hypothetical protein